jgi:predicted GTPase
MGAGGRDFHNFNVVYRDDPAYEVVAFTAAQIPYTAGRTYPHALAGHLYPHGIPIYPEEHLDTLISTCGIHQTVFSYSDVSHLELMHFASRCLSLGSDFVLLGPDRTMLKTRLPVISVCAVRTGCGKSLISRTLALLFKKKGAAVAVVRHPMAYCGFVPSSTFSSLDDIDRGGCTLEEREEFEHLVNAGITVYAGIDYRKVVEEVERREQLLIWDGGNNDFPFLRPDYEIVLIDALRPGQESRFYPGEVNLRRADLVIITKVNEAPAANVQSIREAAARENRHAGIIEAPSRSTVSDPSSLQGRRVLVIEDGPTITHGGMPSGVGASASQDLAAELVDPRPWAVGSLRETFQRYPHIGPVLPAMGYSERQLRDLEATIAEVPADVIVIATPVDLNRLISLDRPTVAVSYEFTIDLNSVVDEFLEAHVR